MAGIANSAFCGHHADGSGILRGSCSLFRVDIVTRAPNQSTTKNPWLVTFPRLVARRVLNASLSSWDWGRGSGVDSGF